MTAIKMRIPITKAVFGPEEMRAVQRPLETGWVVQGPYVQEFEQKFASFTRQRHAIATSSCTTALHIAVAALGLKPGDEVIVPAFTWIATPNVVEYQGARAVFCDIDLRTFNIDPLQIEAKITARTVGIIPVHLFGLCADMRPILDIAKRRNLWVVEDAACAFGAWQNGAHAGSFGEFGCFSFHPRKSITTGEGGMITTDQATQDETARSLRDHGASKSDLVRHEGKSAFLLSEFNRLGYNYRMTDIQGALGSSQMDRAETVLAARAERAALYDKLLAGCSDWLQNPFIPEGNRHGYQSYVCLFRPDKPSLSNCKSLHEHRNAMMAEMEEKGIATRQGTHAPVLLGYYKDKYGLVAEEYPNALFADQLTIALPLFPQLRHDEIEYVCNTLEESFHAAFTASGSR